MSDDDEREAMFDDDEMEAGRQGCRKPSKGRQTPVSNSKKNQTPASNSSSKAQLVQQRDDKKRDMAFLTKGIQDILKAANSATDEQSKVDIDIATLNKKFLAPCYSKPGGRNSTSASLHGLTKWLKQRVEIHSFKPDDDIKKSLTTLDYAIRQSSQGYQISDAGKSPSEVYALILKTLVVMNCITYALAKLLLVWSPATHPLNGHPAGTSKATFYSRFLDNYSKSHNAQWSFWLKYLAEPSTFVFNMALTNVRGPLPALPKAEVVDQPLTGIYGKNYKYCEISWRSHFMGIDLR